MKALLVDLKDFRKEIELPDDYMNKYVTIFDKSVVRSGNANLSSSLTEHVLKKTTFRLVGEFNTYDGRQLVFEEFLD